MQAFALHCRNKFQGNFLHFCIAESAFLCYNIFVKKNWVKPSKIKGFSPVLFRTRETKNKTVFGLSYFLSNPKDWHVISRERVCNPFAMQTVCHQSVSFVCFFLRIDYIHHFVMITSRNKLRITYNAYALIYCGFYAIIY